MAARPPQEDIDSALKVETTVKAEEMELYLDCLNGIPMSARKTDEELRDGCILTHSIFARIREQ